MISTLIVSINRNNQNNRMKKITLLVAILLLTNVLLNAQELMSKTDDVKKSALILIETQNEWMHPDGSLYNYLTDKDLFKTSVSNLESLLGHAREIGMPVIHCGLRFEKGHLELANAKTGLRAGISSMENFPADNFRSEFFETLKPIDGEFVTSGRVGSSGFAESNLDIYLRNNQIETLYIVSYATNVCVESTFREAHDKGYYPVMIHDACATFDLPQQENTINNP